MSGEDHLQDAAPPGPSSVAPDDRLRRWLATHPVALVSLLDRHGRLLPWPDRVPLGPGHQQSDRSLLDLVVDEDRNRVTAAFIEALDHGAATTSIHLLAAPAVVMALNYYDLHAELGGVARLCWDAEGAVEHAGGGRLPAATAGRPRVAEIEKGDNGVITAVDDDFVRMLGWGPDDVIGRRSLSLIHPDDQPRAVDCWMRMVAGSGQHAVRLRHLHADGSWLWLETCNDLRSRTGESVTVRCQLVDVSDEMRAVEALRHREELLRRVTEAVPVGIAHLAPDGTVTYANGALLRLLGALSLESLDDLLVLLPGEDRRCVARGVQGVLSSGRDAEIELNLAASPRGIQARCRLSLSVILDAAAVIGILLCVVDVTELAARATRDALTGTLNRASIVALLDSALSLPGRRVGAAFADLDGFKAINDSFGHAAGDAVLQQVAAGFVAAVGEQGHVGRLGGDEFLVVLPDLVDGAELAAIGGRVRDELARRGIAASLGFDMADAGSCSAAELVERVDRAMYRAKQRAMPDEGVTVASGR
jgi:diguanylate cyclase (GGDEF)-like protein/PAS domain S-box-containing protein